MTSLPLLPLFSLILSIASIANAASIRTAHVVLTDRPDTLSSLCNPTIEATLEQTSAVTALQVKLQISGLTSACGSTSGQGRFSVDIFEYGRNVHTSNANTPADTKATATYQFGKLITSVWTDVSDTLNYAVNLSGVSLQLGEKTSVLGRAMAVQHCSTVSAGSCTTVIASGIIGRHAPTTEGDINIAGPSSSVESGDAALYCSLQGIKQEDVAGFMMVSNALNGATLNVQASGSTLVSGNMHRLSLHPYGGGSNVDQITTSSANVLGYQDNDNTLSTHHNLPCSPYRRLGDLGNIMVRSTSTGSTAEYYARMDIFRSRLSEVVGTSCVLWSHPDVTCDVWDTGCTAITQQRRVLAIGTVGLAPDGSGARVDKPSVVDYDCTSTIVQKVVARLYPVASLTSGTSAGTSFPTISGIATIVAPTTNQENGPTTLDVQLTGTPDGTSYALSIQTTGDVALDGTSQVFAPLNRSPGQPPSSSRRVGDLGNIKAEHSYGYGQLSTEKGLSLDDSARSVVGRAVAVHARPFDPSSATTNPVIAWGVFGLANSGARTNVASAGQRNTQQGTSTSSVVCVLRKVLGADSTVAVLKSGHIRLTAVQTKSAQTAVSAVLVQSNLVFDAASSSSALHSLEIHEYGDLVSGLVGQPHGR